jgi:hypothetical protein
MTTAQTSMYFMKSSCMLFIGGLMVAIAIEHSNVHRHVFQEWLATLKKNTASVPSTYHLIFLTVLRFYIQYVLNYVIPTQDLFGQIYVQFCMYRVV